MPETLQTGHISVQISSGVATLTFTHPASNSFPSYLLQQLAETFQNLSQDPNVNCILLQSEGKTFCAGASFEELLAVDNLTKGTQFFSGFASVINAMRTCSKLIVGKVQGKAVGGGVGLACACDFVMATPQAEVKLSELGIGIGPFVIEPVVSRKIGKQAMTAMTLQPSTWFSAEWAEKHGLFNKIVGTVKELDEETFAFAEKLAQYNPEALSELKRIFWEGTEHWDELLFTRAAISGKLVLSDFTKNALSNFKK